MSLKLSVCFGTLNRLHYLKPCLESIRASAGSLAYEIVVVDGGSTDGTLEFLKTEEQVDPHLRVIYQGERLGAIRAFNAGFFASKGEYVANLNDDVTVEGDTLVRACELLDKHPEAGQVALPFSNPGEPPHVDYVNLWKRKIVYANFGVTRRALGNKAGWWGEGYQYAGDTRLSIEIWMQNYYVLPLEGGHVAHYQARDDTRVPNVESHRIGKTYGNSVAPPILARMGRPKPETNLGPAPHAPRPLRVQQPARIIVKKKRKVAPGVDGMTLIRYLGSGWQVQGAPTGTLYRFSGGAEFYVDDRDVDFIVNHASGHGKVEVL